MHRTGETSFRGWQNPESPWNHRSRQAKFYLGLKMDEDALRDLDKACGLKPYNVAFLVYRSIALQRLGRFDEAEKDLQKALQIRPDDKDFVAGVHEQLEIHRKDRARRSLSR